MTSTSKRAYRVIPNVFGMPFGLCGLAILMVLTVRRPFQSTYMPTVGQVSPAGSPLTTGDRLAYRSPYPTAQGRCAAPYSG